MNSHEVSAADLSGAYTVQLCGSFSAEPYGDRKRLEAVLTVESDGAWNVRFRFTSHGHVEWHSGLSAALRAYNEDAVVERSR